uniref:DNA-dependent protein kinase catalytic subunit n=1 Tax=Neovison vison TaxID=452646 RepID=A0A8C7C4I0_NEOVI
MADSASDVRGSLLQLQESLSAGDRCSAAMASYQLIRGLGQECVLSSGPAVLALQTSLIFSKDFGLLVFVRKSLSIDEFRDCREEVLKFLCIFLEKIGQKITPYSLEIKNTCTSVYTKDKAAKCKIPALDLLIKLLRILRSSRLMDEFRIGELFSKFYGELALKTKVQDTVLEKIYELLGVLGEVHPSEMINNSEKLFRAFLGELKTQMTSAIREPKLPVLAGCLKGLSSLLCNFTKSMEEDPQTSREIFDFALKAIPGLCLFTLHASQFSTCLLDNYVSLFEVLSKWCSHTNVELKKAAHSALESFLKQISSMVAKDVEMHKSKLQYFMEQFYGIIRNMDSNSKDLSIAIRGYGLFAGPCKVVNAKDVDFMYVELIQRCKQLFLTQIDTVDDHVYHMPSFLQSIASVLLYLDTVPEVYTPVLEHLMVVQIDSFPQYSPKMQSVCCKAIVKVFLALRGKGPVLWNCISTVVHQGLIRICSKPVILQKGVESESEDCRASGEVRTGKWKMPTYKDYLDLFRSLLSCDQMMDSLLADEAFFFVNSSLQNLNHLLYDEFVKSVLKIIEKLDLTLEKQNAGGHEVRIWVIPTSDPAANFHPAKPKDFSAFINLVEFCREILPEKHVEFFEPWIHSFAYELILQSTRLPLISGFYKLLSVAMRNAKKIKYFKGVGLKSQTQSPEDPEKYSCFALLAKFGKEVSIKMKQYKDELLASCLTFILSLPHDIIELDIRAYVPALQMAFKLGLSYTPLAEVALNALEEWSLYICKHVIQPHYTDILPSLDGYLKTSALSGKNETRSLEEIRIRVVQMLGFLGGQINKNLLTVASSDEMMKKCVTWDREKRLSFAVPFIEMKPVIYLDVFLPRVTELALSASNRQTKVAACELLHSMVMFMLGKATQMPEGGQGFPPMYQLYKRTFPVLLRLACDVDQVTRQLYEPLVMQLIHWFTSNKKFESQDTVALLETILDGIVDPVDSTLRDFCGRCIREFLKWSIKQTTPQQQEKSPVNTKSLFKRLYSFALHPNAFKRLGASLAFNNIYRDFREEESLVEQFVFEALVTYLESLAIAHADEKSLGTLQQCCDAIDHLRRIIEKKHVSLNKVKKRRRPRGFPPAASLCLLDVVQWLLAHCGRPQTECRHKSIELFYKFVPLLPGNTSPSLWLKDILKNKDTSFLINIFEGGGGDCDRLSGILAQPTLFHLQGPFSLRAVLQWMDMLLAALECYNTFIEEKTLEASEVLGTETQSSLWKAMAFFLENIAMHDITAAEKCFGTGTTGHRHSPQEEERYNYSKCTIVVRIMEFTTVLLSTFPEGCKLLEKDLCNNKNFMKLLVKTLCEPSSIGFNIGDVLVMNHLPDVCVKLIKALKKSPYKDTLEMHLKEKITARSIEELCAVDLYGPDAYVDRAKLVSVVSACKQLHRAGFLHVVLPSQVTTHHSVGTKLLSLVYKSIAPGDEREYFPSLDPSCKRLANGLLELAFAFGGLCEHLVNLLLDTAVLSMPASGVSQRNMVSFSHGEYFYSLFSEAINTELLKNLDLVVLELMKSSVDNPKMVSTVLNGMLDQSFRDRASQKYQGQKLASTILHNWKKWDSWWAKDSTPESKTAVLTLLAKILQIDSSVCFNTNHSAFPEVFTTYASLLADSKLGLHLKGQAVILLPFFTSLTGDSLEDLKHILENLIVSNFPMKSEEFPPGTLRYNNYVDCMKKFLDALELSQSPVLLQLMTEILCREQQHVMEELFQSTFKEIARNSCVTQLALLERVYRMFKRDDLLSNVTRQAFVDRSLLTLLWHCSLNALREFFSKIVVDAIDVLRSRFTKLNESIFDTQITKKMGYYKMLEVMYSRLSKDDVHSKESKINQVFYGSCVTEGNELTKTLIKLCYDAFTENMAGENQLLERRRLYHCAAYNCAISVICCVFTELKFYQGFLFSEKPEKNLLILENLIDLKRCYTFPIEVEVPMERKKKYIEIRKEAREATNGDSGGPHYLSSLSYLADSSLSEEMSQFDFSTGVQSYSYSSQDPKSTPDAVLELEMDELNQHECMATMTTLIKHMHRNQILPKEEGSVPRNLPPWMKFLHDKLGNPSISLNIRLFLAKLVINTEEVFRPYAKYWLSPLLQLVVSENNGGRGIHYMVVEIVVTVLSWTGLATPVGVPKDEVLANRLLHFLMEHVFHQKRAVFRHNLEIIKTLVECWKDCLSVPYRLIFEKFSNKDPNSKDNSVGIQLLGIVIANNLPPYDPKCGIESIKYFQALVSNMSFVKYKEVYVAAAEVLGLILQYITKKENVLEELVYELIIKQLKQHQNTMEDKFIVCLNKAVKNFPPLADRFMNTVFFLLPKFHGVMKTLCLEVVLCRAEEITDLYLQLKSKDFIQVMRHRLWRLTVLPLLAWHFGEATSQAFSKALLRFKMHGFEFCTHFANSEASIIYPESQADDESREVFKLAKDVLIQGLIDENAGLQLIIRNFWSHETRLPSNILDRLLALNSLYSPKIEMHFLSLATDFLLEMTSMSPDYPNPVFEHPLSECEFQEYTIDSDWRFRSTIFTPMFIETQASQSALQTRTQEGSLPFQGVMARQIRATQQQYDFTPTQTADGRSSFNWLTGSSIDPLMDYTVSSSSDSSSSSLLFAHKRSEKFQRTPLKSVGPDFGKKRLGLPGDEVDNKTKDNRTEILRLRRRFIKDQEKLSLIYARKGIAEQKREKEIKSELKMKHDAQVILYRSYRQGDLPDIQIKYSSLITPLQAVAQRDPIIAKELFGSLFSGIIKEMDKYKTKSEKNNITQKLLQDFNHFLNTTFSFFPPFVSCIQEISCQHTDLLSLDPASVSAGCLASLQQPVGVRLLEEALLHLVPQEPTAKRFRGRTRLSPDVVRWMELAKLYRSIGEYDVLRGIFSSEIGTKQVTQSAILAEARSDYSEAVKQYNEALNKQEWVDGEPTEPEKDFWELASLDCYNQLAEWKSLAYCSIVSVDNESPPDLNKMWSEPFYQETYLPYMIRSKLKLLLHGEADQSLLTFIDEAVNKELQKALIELHYSQELSLLYLLQDDVDRAKYYIENCIQNFMQVICGYSHLLLFLGNLSSQAPLKRLLNTWTNRYPDTKMDPMNIWDDIITNRESKARDDWQVQWVQNYCRLSHSRSQGQTCPEQILTALKTVSLLGESTSIYISKNVLAFHDQNILLGTTYRIIAEALIREPTCLAEIEESKARRILDLSGSSTENVIAGLHQRAFHHLSEAVRIAEEEAQPSLMGQGPVASLTDAYMTLVDFCDQQLRKEEESASVTESLELQTYPAVVVDKMLKALKLHSSEDRLKFPRLLQIVELYPEETLSLMTKEISSIPCWQFIGWISHMVALLDKEEAVAVQHTVEEIANNYPQAIAYPFIISSESYSFKDTSTGHKNKEFVARIKIKLDQGGVIQDFISALEQLSNPEMLFKDWIDDMKVELAKTPVNKKNIEKMYERMYAALGNPRAPGLGAFRKRFIQDFGKEFDKHFGKGGSKLPGMKLRDFTDITDSLFYKMGRDSKPPGNLKECSPWMSDFKIEFLRNELEIPGQYDGKGKPMPEYHARISGFDERVKVMASIRKPKRIIIRGHDEKEYPFLVKGGEDLRQDQRIEQLFEVMNVLLSQDAACSQRNMQLKTYHVIPMTSRLGLIEWIENTFTLKDFLLSNMSREEKAAYTRHFLLNHRAASRSETVTSFRRRESKVPADLLKRAFLKMSTGPEAFLALRSHFASSHALMCISHWILGIGDRHLNNFMISMETGGMIGIDFGHAFGSATQFLPVPELMPFRLTRQFINLMLPMKEAGVMSSVMVHALRAFRSHSDLLINTMDVFVKEPSFDWKNFEQKMLKKGGSWIQEINVTEKNWYPRQKIHYAKRKLAGANPAVITCDELFLGHEKALAFVDYVAVARGSKDHNIRAQHPESGLSEEAQVKCLIDQATDPNILGRTWQGWEPWM